MTIEELRDHLLVLSAGSKEAENAVNTLLGQLSKNLSAVLMSGKKQIQTAMSENDFAKASEIGNICADIQALAAKLPKAENEGKPIREITDIEKKENHGSTRSASDEAHTLKEDYQNKKISAYAFDGKTVKVSSWLDAQLKFLLELKSRHPDQFEMILTDPNLKGKTRAYFTKEASFTNGGVQDNTLIPGTDIYVQAK